MEKGRITSNVPTTRLPLSISGNTNDPGQSEFNVKNAHDRHTRHRKIKEGTDGIDATDERTHFERNDEGWGMLRASD